MHLYSWFLFFSFEECLINCQGDSRGSYDKSFFTSIYFRFAFSICCGKICLLYSIIIKETDLGKTIIANITSVGSFVHELILDFFTIEPKEEQSGGTAD